MRNDEQRILVVNGGSSSVKFASYRVGETLERERRGSVEGIGGPAATVILDEGSGPRRSRWDSNGLSGSSSSPAGRFLDWLESHAGLDSVVAVGHRVVHGMKRSQPALVTRELLNELKAITPYDPDHLPRELELIAEFSRRYPQLQQVACFDTAFHQTMPRVAKLYPLPRRLDAKGVQRYGFHGLSYTYLMEQLAREAGKEAAQGRVILAHLGNGASVAAVKGGRSIDTSMGFTPTGGLPMGTRSGDLDPGLAPFLERTEQVTTEQFFHMVNHQSGLLGVSETSSDMRELLAQEAEDARAAEAVALFCYQTKKWIGAFAAALGGLDILVFAGGIGENAAAIRTRVCEGLGFLGVQLDEARNATHAALISTDGSATDVRVIPTDEELVIARSACGVLGLGASSKGEDL